MAEVICDTSFVMHVATARIRNEGSVDTEIGELRYTVPPAVMAELGRLRREGEPARAAAAAAALAYIERRAVVAEPGGAAAAAAAEPCTADERIVGYVRAGAASIVATMDAGLKREVKRAGGAVLSVSGDRIVLEP